MAETGEAQEGEVLDISVNGLAQWLFGFRTLKEIAAEEGRMGGSGLPDWTKGIRPIDGVFLDEIV